MQDPPRRAMRPSPASCLLSLFLATFTNAADGSTRPGPLRLVTTASMTTPVNSTGNIVLYYLNPTPGILNLFTTDAFFGDDFQLYNGVLGTFRRKL